jgi:hypothetical protein
LAILIAAGQAGRLLAGEQSASFLIALAVVAVVVGIWLVGYTLFSSGDTPPGDGRGTPTTVESTP